MKQSKQVKTAPTFLVFFAFLPLLLFPENRLSLAQNPVPVQVLKQSRSAAAPPIQLEAVRAGRHKEFGSIVLQFSKRYRYKIPRIKNGEIRFILMNTETRLKAFKKFKSFDSWVRLDKGRNGIHVSIGIPKHFEKHVVIPLSNPYRLAINLYIGSPPTEKPKDSSVSEIDKTPEAAPTPSPHVPQSQASIKSVRLTSDDIRQIDLIVARIYSRKGLYEKSIRLYEQLRQRYPDDEEIWEDYIETMVNFSHYEQAIWEIGKLRQKNPENLRGQRILARIYLELRQNRWTFPIFENVLSQNRNDVGIWSDYAFARQDVGLWSDALHYFSRVLELDPENESALRSVHEILKEHRPSLQTGYSLNTQESGDARVQSIPVRYSQHLSPQSKIDLVYDRIEVDRSQDIGLDQIEQTVNDVYAILRYQVNPSLAGNIGVGGYDGMGDGTSLFFGLDYTPWADAVVRSGYAWHRPWFDPVDAAAFEGSYNQLNVSFDWSINPSWGIFLGGELWDYQVEDDRDYGQKSNFTGILTRRLSNRPDFSLSYAFFYSHFTYEDDTFTPIDMIPTEVVHSLSGDFEHWVCTYWAIRLSGGRRWDVERKINSWYVIPGIRLRLGNRIESDISYEFSTEAGTVAGGNTGTFRISSKFIF